MRADEHRRYRELLGAYVSGQLEHGEATGLERHLERCAGCRGEEAELREIVVLLNLARALPPFDLKARVLTAVFRESSAEGAGGGAARIETE